MNRRGFGAEGEQDVGAYLEGKGYRILAMNYTRSTGEIDLIAQERDTVVFVEVKRRTSQRYGRPAEAVTPTKRRRIVRTALLYLQQTRQLDVPVRFDVIELLPGELRHIEAAFDATGMNKY